MKNFKIVKTCITCKHVFHWQEYDCDSIWYCNFTNDRPVSGSVLLDEVADLTEYDEDWYRKHRVYPHGICDLYEKRSNDDDGY